jgi:hypothetical protein
MLRLALLTSLLWPPFAALAQPHTWNPDANGDGAVETQDLLELLAVFGSSNFETITAAGVFANDDPCEGLTQFEHLNHTYALVRNRNACWFAENLRVAQYTNGDWIETGLNSSEWLSARTGAMAIYGEGNSRVYSGSEDEHENLQAYGRLYNYCAVVDPRGLCPAGWHVPSDLEWSAWEAADSDLEELHALPGGGRNYGGFFGSGGKSGLFWTTTPVDGDAVYRRVEAGSLELTSGTTHRQMGASVRCVRSTSVEK